MRKSPTILAAVFILITLVRVAEFADTRMKAGWLGWLFSIALGAGVYFFSWFTREHIAAKQTEEGEKADRRSLIVQRWAWGGLVVFVFVDGIFNASEVWYSVQPQDIFMGILAVLYGLFPTLAAAALGALQGHVDRLPQPPPSRNAVIPAIRRLITSKINGMITEVPDVPMLPYRETTEPQRETTEVFRYWCEPCKFGTDEQRKFAGHCNSTTHKERHLHPVTEPSPNGKAK